MCINLHLQDWKSTTDNNGIIWQINQVDHRHAIRQWAMEINSDSGLQINSEIEIQRLYKENLNKNPNIIFSAKKKRLWNHSFHSNISSTEVLALSNHLNYLQYQITSTTCSIKWTTEQYQVSTEQYRITKTTCRHLYKSTTVSYGNQIAGLISFVLL